MNTVTIDVIPSRSLLEIMEHRSIPVQSHCRGGFCGACRTKLIEGEVEYSIEPLAFINDDEVLPCACKPTTSIQISTN